MIGERRRPALPGELLARIALVWIGLAVLQVVAVVVTGIFAPHAGIGVLGLPALASFAALGCILLLVGRLAYRFFDVETAGLACLTCAISVPLMAVLRPVESDLAAWQVIALLLALNGLMARDPRHGGWTIGAALALSLALSTTSAPLAATLLAILAAKWLRNRAERDWLVHALIALTAGIAATIGVQSALGVAVGCGGVQPAHLAAIGSMALVAAALKASEPHPRGLTVAGFGVALAGAGAILSLTGSGCAVSGALPNWSSFMDATPPHLIQAIGMPAVALVAALRLFGQARDWLRRWWGDYLALLAVVTVLAAFEPGAAPAAGALAAAPLGWQLRTWFRAARNARRSSNRAVALASIALAAAPAFPLTLVMTASPGAASELAERPARR